jgi:hypothetical protein
MKKFALMVLALLTVVGVSAFGFEMAGPIGSMAALGLGTSAVAYAFNSYAMEGRLYAAIGPMRPLRRNESNLSGIVELYIYTQFQFAASLNFPGRGKGLISSTPFLIGEPSAIFRFDPGTCKGTWAASGPITNQTYKHMLEFDTSGFMQEHLDTLDDLYNQGILAVALYPNGDRVVYGSTRAYLAALPTGDTGAKPEDDGKKTKVKFESIVGCDYPPRKLDSSVTVHQATLPAYPTLVGGLTP